VKIEVNPLIGIGPVHLGMTRVQVRAVLGEPNNSQGNREFFPIGLTVSFDLSGTAEFIESSRSKGCAVYFRGVPVHDTPADELVAHISKLADFDQSDPELGHSYIFKSLQLSLWRSTVPESPDDEDGRYFQAVGVGAHGYFV